MRILFTVSNWAGHYMCMIPLAWAFRAAGHEVRIACPPQQVTGVVATGLMPVGVLEAVDMVESTRLVNWTRVMNTPPQSGTMPLPLHPSSGSPLESADDFDPGAFRDFWKRAVSAMQRSYDNAVEFGEKWRPDLVVHDVMAAEGALVGELLDVPSVYFGPGFIGTVEREPGFDLVSGDPLSCFTKYGVDWDRSRIKYMVDPSPSPAIPPLGDALRIPIRYEPYNGARDVDPMAFGPIRGKRVCLVWGNSVTQVFGREVPALRHAIEAAASRATEVVVTTADAHVENEDTLPANVRILQQYPIELILPTCDLLIHHGSANCLMNGLTAGVPQLSLAVNGDGEIYGRRLDPLGATKTISGLMAEPESIDNAVAEVLFDHRYRRRAQELGRSIAAAPTPARVAELLVVLAREKTLEPPDVAALEARGRQVPDLPDTRTTQEPTSEVA